MSGIKYNLNGQRTKIEYGNGTGTSYEYDERNHRLKRLETRNAKSILQTIEYEYDATGNVTERESEMLGTDGRMKRAVHEYEYDSSGRLTEGSGKVERTTGGILRPNIVSYKSKYAYDTIGNILTKTQAVNGGESSLSCDDTYTYGGKQPHAVTKAGAMVFTYDDNGNMIKRENKETKNTMTLVWDDENRLIKTTDSFHTTDYRYDANGERIIKKSELGETQYISANYIVRNKTVISKHVFAGNQRIASTVSMKNNCGTMTEQNTMYFHPDHLGSSSYVTDKKGNFFEMIEYLPYGETLYDEAATVDKTEFRFTSKEQDAETGLYYYGARYRDARTGVWLSVDPILEMYLDGKPNAGVYNSINLNLYHYAENNPVKMTDPSGKSNEVESPSYDLKGWQETRPKWVSGKESKGLYDSLQKEKKSKDTVVSERAFAIDKACDKAIAYQKKEWNEQFFKKGDLFWGPKGMVINDLSGNNYDWTSQSYLKNMKERAEKMKYLSYKELARISGNHKGSLRIDNLHFEFDEGQLSPGNTIIKPYIFKVHSDRFNAMNIFELPHHLIHESFGKDVQYDIHDIFGGNNE